MWPILWLTISEQVDFSKPKFYLNDNAIISNISNVVSNRILFYMFELKSLAYILIAHNKINTVHVKVVFSS